MWPLTKESEYLFVYGTLLRGQNHPMHSILANYANFIGKGATRGRLYRLEEYPAAVPSTSASDILWGEVYRLGDQAPTVLRLLDQYEGCGPDDPQPTEFCRQQTTISLENGQTITAWIYWYNRPTHGLNTIPSGDYQELL